jgi:hypothetical protein
MRIPILGANVDARIVAGVRAVVIAAIIAGIAAAQKILADPSLESYGWVPIAVYVLRQIEGFFDHADPERPG